MILSPTFPVRPPSLPGGSEFLNSIINLPPGIERENHFLSQLLAGNIPPFMQHFMEVGVSNGTDLLICNVSPDVLCIGSDQDYCRIPLYPHTAQQVADLLGCMLPTDTLSRQIWGAADLKLTPIPRGSPYDQSMEFTSTFMWHNQAINQEINGQQYAMLTGHKKDVIIHPGLLQYPNNVCIYGWYYPSGQGIQVPPQYKAHSKYYSDYSHSARLVNRAASLNGQTVDLYELLKNPNYASLISDEGAFDPTNIYK
jgi:hypothetical protein